MKRNEHNPLGPRYMLRQLGRLALWSALLLVSLILIVIFGGALLALAPHLTVGTGTLIILVVGAVGTLLYIRRLSKQDRPLVRPS